LLYTGISANLDFILSA